MSRLCISCGGPSFLRPICSLRHAGNIDEFAADVKNMLITAKAAKGNSPHFNDMVAQMDAKYPVCGGTSFRAAPLPHEMNTPIQGHYKCNKCDRENISYRKPCNGYYYGSYTAIIIRLVELSGNLRFISNDDRNCTCRALYEACISHLQNKKEICGGNDFTIME
jgi:hypothetical protein